MQDHEVLLLTLKQAAQMLQMSPKFINDHQDELGAIRMGGSAKRAGRLRFQRAALERYIRQNGRKRGSNATPHEESDRLVS